MEGSQQESSGGCGIRNFSLYSCELCTATCLAFFFSTVCGVLTSVLLRVTTEDVLMGFKVLPLTIYSNTGSYSESEE